VDQSNCRNKSVHMVVAHFQPQVFCCTTCPSHHPAPSAHPRHDITSIMCVRNYISYLVTASLPSTMHSEKKWMSHFCNQQPQIERTKYHQPFPSLINFARLNRGISLCTTLSFILHTADTSHEDQS